ncbi:MAG TPA: methionyl-tRNA formyltransferase [Candidatus Binatia bacterium]|jgi:methionyl-tRNA formyltransferase
MRIVFMGTPEVAAFSLERLLQGPDPVIGVVTQPDRPSGRGQKTVPTPVRKVAEGHDIPVLAPEKIRDPSFLDVLKKWAPDLIVVVAYGRILPRHILELAPHGCLNVHYSLLPKYRGAAPVAWAIINGEKQSGVTTMRLVEKMDTGPIFLQRAIPLAEDETRVSLQGKLAPLGAELLVETIAGLKTGKMTPKDQNESEVSYAPILKKEDGLVDWKLTAAAIERRVRGLAPWPSAFTYLAGNLLKIHRARVVETATEAAPGEVVTADKEGLWIATGNGVLSLEQVQLENKKRMTAGEFLNGARVEKGTRL